jgi:putative selenium metabolism hydrolase
MSPTEQLDPGTLAAQAEAWRDEVVELARRLVATPSLCGEEGALVNLLTDKMRALGYDEVAVDELGNCIGRIRGNGTGPSVLFTCHLDHQAPGELADWQYGPYEGRLADGFLHGRGASNHKGALAAMVYGGALLKKLGIPLRGDYIFAGVVQAHAKGNVGMRYLVDKALPDRGIQYDLVVLGSPTNLDVHLGHRGRLELEVLTIGRTSHAGAPWLGVNAVAKMVGVIDGVLALGTSLPGHPFLDKSTIAITGIESAPAGGSRIPDRCLVSLDRRFLPAEAPDAVVWQVQSIVNQLAANDPEFKGEVRVRQAAVTSYTGLQQTAAKLMHPFVTESHHALVRSAVAALEAAGQQPRLGKWNFTTDGGYTAAIKKIATIGYAPGDEKFAQTPFDRLSIDKLVQAVGGYAAISHGISGSACG